MAGISLKPDVKKDIGITLYYMIYSLQHRGQESAGISTYHEGKMFTVKDMGLVSEVFTLGELLSLKGGVGIAQNRYSTTGGSRLENCQPFLVEYKDGTAAIGYNGNLTNYEELRNELEVFGRTFVSDSDTEVIAQILALELLNNDIEGAMKELIRRLRGSYSLVILIDDTLVALRDPKGIKPLVIGRLDGGYAAASESAAIDAIGGVVVRDVNPGEMAILKNGTLEWVQLERVRNPAFCIFEYVYFARPDSIIDGRSVYDVRFKVGETLYNECETDADLASPVPDSGITFALGYSNASNLTYREVLFKNRYVGRTFIMPNQELREEGVKLKLNMIRHNVKGRRIVLVDDSIVRGTTCHRIIKELYGAGAKEIHFRIGFPPIISPCYLGIDMPTKAELIASDKTPDEINELLESNTLHFISLDGLIKAVGIEKDRLCTGCLTGKYPVEIPRKRFEQLRLTGY